MSIMDMDKKIFTQHAAEFNFSSINIFSLNFSNLANVVFLPTSSMISGTAGPDYIMYIHAYYKCTYMYTNTHTHTHTHIHKINT